MGRGPEEIKQITYMHKYITYEYKQQCGKEKVGRKFTPQKPQLIWFLNSSFIILSLNYPVSISICFMQGLTDIYSYFKKRGRGIYAWYLEKDK